MSKLYDLLSAMCGKIKKSDWNQNNPAAPDYVKNRPFYIGEPVETVLVEESTVPFKGDEVPYFGAFQSTFVATVGETYKVSWDGTVYERTCADVDGIAAIGNPSILGTGSDTGEPFVMLVDNGMEITILTEDTSSSHTISISGIVAPIVKIPAKYIDKDAAGYIAIHSNDTMTQQEAENYRAAISTKEVVFIIWDNICIKRINPDSNNLRLETQNGETYLITKNGDGLFAILDRKIYRAEFPNSVSMADKVTGVTVSGKKIIISSNSISSGVGSTDALFSVQANGTKSKGFEVLGNGETVTPAIILYSSTASSKKKFRITVDDSGTLIATEVTE